MRTKHPEPFNGRHPFASAILDRSSQVGLSPDGGLALEEVHASGTPTASRLAVAAKANHGRPLLFLGELQTATTKRARPLEGAPVSEIANSETATPSSGRSI